MPTFRHFQDNKCYSHILFILLQNPAAGFYGENIVFSDINVQQAPKKHIDREKKILYNQWMIMICSFFRRRSHDLNQRKICDKSNDRPCGK